MAWLIDQVLSIAYPQGKTFRSYCIGTGGYKPEIKHPLNRISTYFKINGKTSDVFQNYKKEKVIASYVLGM